MKRSGEGTSSLKEDMHGYGQRLDKNLKEIQEHTAIIEPNKKHVLDFYEFCKAQGLSTPRLAKILYQMKYTAMWLGSVDFKDAKRGDLVRVINLIQDRFESPYTVSDYKVVVKKFYKFLLGGGKKMPKLVEWINSKPTENRLVEASSLYTEDDMLMILTAETPTQEKYNQPKIRNKAFIFFLYDAGVRISEALQMRLKDIEIDDPVWFVTVTGKTGTRTFPIYPSIPYLKEYLAVHPKRTDPEAYLWCSLSNPNRHIQYMMIRKILKNAVKRAGINKPTNPHNFRHSSVTKDAKYMSDQELKVKYGWSADSKQLRTYSHLRGKDLTDKVKKHYGITHKEEKSRITVKICVSCGKENNPDMTFCHNCKTPLNMEEIRKAKFKQDAMIKLVFRLLDSFAEKSPEIKDDFRKIVKKENMEWVFDE